MKEHKTVYLIGLGPGDPELITIKSKKILEAADLVIVPQSDKRGRSIAKEIVLNFINEDKIMMYYFPMTNDKEELNRRYAALSTKIAMILEKGKTICYVTIGDPTIYSTCNYLKTKLMERNIHIKLVPAISAFNAASCALGLSLCEKKENFGVYEMPTETERIISLIKCHGSVVFMKVNKNLGLLLEAINKVSPENAYLINRIGLKGEKIYNLLIEIPPIEAAYLSTVIVRL